MNLKPCPFCGADVEMKYDSGDERTNQNWSVECQCGVSTSKVYGSNTWASNDGQDNAAQKAVADHWNNRAVSTK